MLMKKLTLGLTYVDQFICETYDFISSRWLYGPVCVLTGGKPRRLKKYQEENL